MVSHYVLLTLLFSAAYLLFPLGTLAAVLSPRQVTNVPLSISWGPAGNVYLDTKLVHCGPYPIALYGRSPPFKVDAIAWGRNLTWLPDVPKKTGLVMRITDAEGRVAFSEKKEVKDGQENKWMCKLTKAGRKKEALDIVTFVFSIASLFIILVLLGACCCKKKPPAELAAPQNYALHDVQHVVPMREPDLEAAIPPPIAPTVETAVAKGLAAHDAAMSAGHCACCSHHGHDAAPPPPFSSLAPLVDRPVPQPWSA
ncbi:hypothetical protein JCM8547_000387 [Rhodosporidiobolus lusitaniae]